MRAAPAAPTNSLNTELDKLYFKVDVKLFKQCLNEFSTTGLIHYALANKSREESIIGDIANGSQVINADLYKAYSENFRKGVGDVFFEDNGNGLSDQLRANVSRFAAYKAYHATQQVRDCMIETGSIDDAKKVVHQFNRYQAAEYNTTVSRCRTAKMWQEFDNDDSRRLFPNIEWLPSRSVTLRDEHVKFYNRVWAKDDPFWSNNQPGNLWNCKCDWEETDDPVTDGNPNTSINAKGLDGNPAQTGEVFTDECTYVKKTGKITLDDETSNMFPSLQMLLNTDTKNWRADFFNDNGGCLLTSRKRIAEAEKNKQEEEKFNKEYNMCVVLAQNKFNVEYRESIEGSFDIYLNGKPAELKKTKSANNMVKYASKAIKKQGAEIVVFEFEKLTTRIIKELDVLTRKEIPFIYFETNERVVKSTSR